MGFEANQFCTNLLMFQCTKCTNQLCALKNCWQTPTLTSRHGIYAEGLGIKMNDPTWHATAGVDCVNVNTGVCDKDDYPGRPVFCD